MSDFRGFLKKGQKRAISGKKISFEKIPDSQKLSILCISIVNYYSKLIIIIL